MNLSRLRATDKIDEIDEADRQLPVLAASIKRRLGTLYKAVRVRRSDDLPVASVVVKSHFYRQFKEEIDSLPELLAEGKMQDMARPQAVGQSASRQTVLLIASGGLLTLGLIIGALRSINLIMRRVGDQLRDSEAMSRALTRSMAEGVVTSGQDRVLTEANPAAQKLLDYTRDEIVRRQVTHLMPERYWGQFDLLLDELSERKIGFSETGREVPAMRKGGFEFTVSVSFGDVVVAEKHLFSATVPTSPSAWASKGRCRPANTSSGRSPIRYWPGSP